MTPGQRTRDLWRITVSPRGSRLDAHGAAVLKDVHELGLPHVQRVASGRLFFIEGGLAEELVRRIALELLTDPVTETADWTRGGDDAALPGGGFDAAIEVHLKGGVMDPVAASTLAAIGDMGIDTEGLGIATARLYRLAGAKSLDEVAFIARRLLANDCIEDIYLTGFGRHDPRPDHLPVAPTREFKLRHVPIRQLDDAALMKLSREGHLFCSLEEMRAIQQHYRKLQRDPTDLEIETLAQTWSEHCVHKTLKSSVLYRGAAFPSATAADQSESGNRKPETGDSVQREYGNLLRDTIARATRELIDSGRVDWCLSVFEDNAGIITFDDEYAVAFKVETHNHPSAIEPYGGSATGIGGVIRDVLGCGLGAKPIANTDVFCVGRPDFPMELLPKGVLHPRRVLKGVVSGVRDYGNRMGIPTINGAILFDDRYLGNPLVFCGCVGLIPRDRIDKAPRPGDLVVVIGGRTGRDGIHGATFSSAELTDTHATEFSHAVQIGNAITEKKVTDVLLQARDHAGGCLYTAVTDCGAGGLSSAVGEMGSKLGATVDLEKVPLKYSGLRYDEIWISEAQERMVFAVPPEKWPALRSICEAEDVEATVLGSFRDDGRLVIRYQGEVVGDIDAHFLHEGIPRTRREATWSRRGDEKERPSDGEGRESGNQSNSRSLQGDLLARLSELNAASKEWVIRQYDHEVQGASVVKPLTGPGDGPSDAAVIRPRLDSHKGVVMANGICPELGEVDPYWMAVAGIDEAIRNVVCVGGDPAKTAILDNFCWGNCENPEMMGALVRACQGCYDAAVTYGTPFISGKDSLNNEFALDPADAARLAARVPVQNNRIRIPSTLLISAMAVVEDVRKCITMDAKRAATAAGSPSSFYLVALRAADWRRVEIADAAALHRAVANLIAGGKVLAAHDCGMDGWLPALAEMAFAGRCGMDVTTPQGAFADPFAAVPCGYLLQVSDHGRELVEQLGTKLPAVVVQQVASRRPDEQFIIRAAGQEASLTLDELLSAWRGSLNW